MQFISFGRVAKLVAPVVFLACATREQAPGAASQKDSTEVTELTPAAKPATVAAASTKGPTQSGTMTAFDASAPAARTSPRDTVRVDGPEPEVKSDFKCGIKGNPILTNLGMGNLQVGRTMAVVKRTCRVRRDLQEMNEGSPERILTVLINGIPVRVQVVNGLVWKIDLSSPMFATRSGLRVGTSLARLVEKRKVVHLSEGEDGLHVSIDDYCGLDFRFSIPSRETPGKRWTVDHVVKRFGNAPVDKISVKRCAG
ncbi:MAG TPA: hypothetical protein VM099_00520 [Gemmatimonadaceae bacterium]|nr:hypothetical protein [Gemmatimonadaceae bacterium]